MRHNGFKEEEEEEEEDLFVFNDTIQFIKGKGEGVG